MDAWPLCFKKGGEASHFTAHNVITLMTMKSDPSRSF